MESASSGHGSLSRRPFDDWHSLTRHADDPGPELDINPALIDRPEVISGSPMPVPDRGSYGLPEEQEESSNKDENLLWEAMTCILRLVKSAGSKQVNALLRVLTDKSFNMEQFVEHGRSVTTCKSYVSSRLDATVSHSGFTKIEMSLTESSTGAMLYTKDIKEVLQNQVSFAVGDNFSFRPPPNQPTLYYQPMDTPYFRELYNNNRLEVMCCQRREIYWVEIYRNNTLLSWVTSRSTRTRQL